MAVSSMPPSGKSRPPRGNARMKFFLFTMVVMLGLGFFGGLSTAKSALKGPAWVQRMLGIELPPVDQTAAVPPKATVAPVASPPPPAAPAQTPPTNPPADSHAVATSPPSGATKPTAPPSPADEQGFLGRWQITDEVPSDDGAPTKIDSAYIFNADGTGEFDTNGKKMYSLRWTIAGEFLTLTYDNEQAPQGEDGAIRMRWSVTPDKTLLTLVPDNGKDARATLYSVGPGVYHRK